MASRAEFLSLFNNTLPDKLFINYFFDEGIGLSISLSEFNSTADRTGCYWSNIVDKKCQYIGVYVSDYLWLPCLLLSIWKSGRACACIGTQYSEDYNLTFLNVLGVKYLITDAEVPKYNSDLMAAFQINSHKFYIWERKGMSASLVENEAADICYGIMTSGSTGAPKIIRVPWSCIVPNVYELITRLNINEEDNVYLSSPYTFDPFFIELFISLITRCTLTVVSSNLKMSSESLVNVLFRNGKYISNEMNQSCADTFFICRTNKISKSLITVLQMTPSIFRRWGKSNIKSIILSADSSLKILLLGGEKFPADVLKLKSISNITRIFNIYGITEISCWAFINEACGTCEEISLGSPLNGIVYKIDDNNELHIGSKERICFVDSEKNLKSDEVIYRKTGDIVSLQNDNIYYICRTNEIVKKFGIKISLKKIENLFLSMHKEIEECFCIFDEDTMKTALFYLNKNLEKEYSLLLGTEEKEVVQPKNKEILFTNAEVPDYVVEIAKIPLNSNGKCDRKTLIRLFRTIMKVQTDDRDIENVFKRVWSGLIGGNNFVHSGGDSVRALQVIMRLEESGFSVPKNFLTTLMKDGDLENCFRCLTSNLTRCTNKRLKLQIEKEIYKFSVLWKFDMSKCIDAPPSIFYLSGKANVIVGSHSSKLSSVEIDTGHENWTITLGGRIESGVCIDKLSTFGVVGCYDHHVYCISISDGHKIWNYKTCGMIKSTPCLSTDEKTVYVASYDTYLYCIKCCDGSLVSKIQLSDGGIFSSGVVSYELKAFYIATLDGTCISMNQESNEIMWKRRLGSPVFSSPVLIVNDHVDICVMFAEVTGRLNAFNAKTGNKIWCYESRGYIYSTAVFTSNLQLLIFGCYDSHLYALKVSEEPFLQWKTQLHSPVFGKPCLCAGTSDLIAVASTKGWLYLCRLESGSCEAQIKLDGEIFSSPKINESSLTVGCRDNFMYCIKIQKSFQGQNSNSLM